MADSKVVFEVATEMVMNGRELKALTPDKNGVYTGIPLMLIGAPSRNNVMYDVESVKECMTNPRSRFVMNLKSGDLEGEWGHPLLSCKDKAEMLQRLLYLDRKCVSHVFTKVYAKDAGNGTLIVYGDVKPSGPYGDVLDKNFRDPVRNVSFSLRSATEVTGTNNGIVNKRMLTLFTIDAVDGPGYAEACKRFRDPSLESLGARFDGSNTVECAVTKRDLRNATESLKFSGQESKLVDQRILDMLECDSVVIKETPLRRIGAKGFADEKGNRVSLFDRAFGL